MSISAYKTQFSSAGLDAAKSLLNNGSKPGLDIPQDKAASGGISFGDYLKDGVKEVNEMQKTADKMGVDVASGKNENLHETMLAMSKAELGFNFMVQVRNKALDAYQEIMRMPV